MLLCLHSGSFTQAYWEIKVIIYILGNTCLTFFIYVFIFVLEIFVQLNDSQQVLLFN